MFDMTSRCRKSFFYSFCLLSSRLNFSRIARLLNAFGFCLLGGNRQAPPEARPARTRSVVIETSSDQIPGCFLSIQRFNTRTPLYANADAICPTRPPRARQGKRARVGFFSRLSYVSYQRPPSRILRLFPRSLSVWLRLWFVCHSKRRFGDAPSRLGAHKCHSLMTCFFFWLARLPEKKETRKPVRVPSVM